jgi:hypothetical protein
MSQLGLLNFASNAKVLLSVLHFSIDYLTLIVFDLLQRSKYFEGPTKNYNYTVQHCMYITTLHAYNLTEGFTIGIFQKYKSVYNRKFPKLHFLNVTIGSLKNNFHVIQKRFFSIPKLQLDNSK